MSTSLSLSVSSVLVPAKLLVEELLAELAAELLAELVAELLLTLLQSLLLMTYDGRMFGLSQNRSSSS